MLNLTEYFLKRKKYKIYTDKFDKVIKAENLETKEELERLRATLDQQLLQLKSFASKLANKLQRRFWQNRIDLGILI